MIAYLLLSGTIQDFSQEPVNFDADLWKGISRMAKNFIRSALSQNPEKRPSASVALEHNWITT
jgi:serine/threonine protein kinase